MNITLLLIKISLVLKKVFDRKSGEELQAMKDHFEAAYSDAQLCALVAVGMICRVFGLVNPDNTANARSLWSVVGLFIQFLKSLGDPEGLRSGPNPLDALVMEGIDELDLIGLVG